MEEALQVLRDKKSNEKKQAKDVTGKKQRLLNEQFSLTCTLHVQCMLCMTE